MHVVAEFNQSQRHLYQLLDAAKVERNICAISQNDSTDNLVGAAQ
jgi:hypothetical protein